MGSHVLLMFYYYYHANLAALLLLPLIVHECVTVGWRHTDGDDVDADVLLSSGVGLLVLALTMIVVAVDADFVYHTFEFVVSRGIFIL